MEFSGQAGFVISDRYKAQTILYLAWLIWIQAVGDPMPFLCIGYYYCRDGDRLVWPVGRFLVDVVLERDIV